MKNMDDYHDHYLKKDVFLLADVFEKFTSESLKFDKLDPSHYFSSTGLSSDAMLKMTGLKLELISDKEFLTSVRDLVKQTTNAWKIMILQKKVSS